MSQRRRRLVATAALAQSAFSITAHAQAREHAFITGMCTLPDTMFDMNSVASTPSRTPALKPTASIPNFLHDNPRPPGYEGTVVVAFVVDARGVVVPSTVAVMSSSDPALSDWACTAARQLVFVPAEDGGHPVAAEATMPLTFRRPALPAPKDSTRRQ
jgi:TonB family protein